MNQNIVKWAFTTAACLSLLFSTSAFADAGKAIFVYGKVYVTSADGDRRVLRTGGQVEEGETVTTASNGRTQLQMADGGLLALRPGTEFLIEQFQMPEEKEFATAEPRSFFVLIKGGFRSITGAIGKENKANYRVTTPVATIGIRGTDYDAVFCASDCAAYSKLLGTTVKNGLYIGVNSGGVVMQTATGSLDLNAGEYGFAKDARSTPSRSDEAASVLSTQATAAVNSQAEPADESEVSAEPVAADVGVSSTDADGNSNDLVSGEEFAPAGTGAVAFSRYADTQNSGVSAAGAPVRDANGSLVGFNDDDASIRLTNSEPVNVGRDSDRDGATDLSWGRWAEGTTQVTVAGVTTESAQDGSVHYVAAADGAITPVLPVTGSAEFDLVGNTDPTDNRGNVGTLGSANLSADFTAQTVDADVSLSFQETSEVWNASANDVDINTADATFAGAFDTVDVTGDNGVAQGSGDLGGFFSGNDAGDVTGAGMTFSLEQGGTTVDGSAAFQRGD
ncbi:MAG: FecR domain-containing protein [Gammaproteobacteria bacterium]